MSKLKEWWTPALRQAWVVSALLINKLGQGMTLGMLSAFILALQGPNSDIQVDLDTLSWMGSLLAIGALPGYIIVSFLMNKLGRKAAYCIKTVPAIIGFILAAYATNVTALMISRVLLGITMGSTTILGAMIVGECTSPRYRGMFLMLKTASFNLGCLVIHVLANYIDWRKASLVTAIPYIVSTLIAFTWPESPSWLAEKKEFKKSIETFYWLRGKSKETTREIIEIINMNENKKLSKTFAESVVIFMKKFKKKNFIKPFIITIFTSIIMECSGKHVFPSYAAVLVKGVASNSLNSFYCTIIIDIIITSSSYLSSYLMKTFKMRMLLFSTGFVSFIVLNLACLNMYFMSVGILSTSDAWVTLSLICAYFIAANLCCAPVPLTIIGEIYPLEHRATGTFISGYIISIGVFISVKSTPFLLVTLDFYGAFAIFGLGLAFSLLVLYFILPETKDQTLQEIEYFFVHGHYRENQKLEGDEEVNMMMINDDKI